MATRKLVWRIDATQQGARLDLFLAASLARALAREFSRSEVRRLIEAGAVRCNGRRERMASCQLHSGMQIEAWLESSAPAPPQIPRDAGPTDWTPARILFEDEWLVAVDKPPGLPTQPTLDARRPSAFSTLQAYLKQREGGAPYLGLHHRLDRDTSGVLLFTKQRGANAGTSALFAGKTIRKTYQAVTVAGAAAPDTWETANHLGVVGRVQKADRFGAVRSGGDPAQTSFRILERLPAALFVEARPHTGRTHQIRVHLSEGGHAILGDPLYGGPTRLAPAAGGPGDFPVSRVMLHAAALEFPHPVTGAALKITCPLPADLEQCLRELRSGARPTG